MMSTVKRCFLMLLALCMLLSVPVCAEAAYADDMYTTGLMYFSGEGFAQNYDKAMEYFLYASEAGNEPAGEFIDLMLKNGQGIKSYYAYMTGGDFDAGSAPATSAKAGTGSKIVDIAVGENVSLALRADGTVSFAGGENYYGGCFSVEGWEDVSSVHSSLRGIFGIKNDGSMLFVGPHFNQHHMIEGWTDIVQFSSSGAHSLGLRSDGSVIETENESGYPPISPSYFGRIKKLCASLCSAGAFTHILDTDGTLTAYYGANSLEALCYNVADMVSSGWATVALKKDGTVKPFGIDAHLHEEAMSTWRNIVEVAAGDCFAMGLKSDGTVLWSGYAHNDWLGDDISTWRDIKRIYCSEDYCIGLRGDGSLAVSIRDGSYSFGPEELEELKSWTDIVKLEGSWSHILGLRSDGTVVAAGKNLCGECDVSEW